MKLIIVHPNKKYTSKNILESQAFTIAQQLQVVDPKSKYEFVRGYNNTGNLVIVYKDNRVLRTKNAWFEMRGLSKLSHILHMKFEWGYKQQWKGYETEIDGVNRKNGIAVEIKRTKLHQKDISFLENKVNALNFDELIIIATKYSNNISPQKNTTLYKFTPSWQPILDYYNNNYKVWDAFWDKGGQRHFRFLLANGRWRPQRRRYTKTAKWQPYSRMIQEINYYHSKNKTPVKIYYSLSRMISPLNEFEGKGMPFDKIIGVFDVDGSHKGAHIIGTEGYCKLCRQDANHRLKILIENIETEGYEYKVLHSGTKGYHVYLLDKNKQILELSHVEMKRLTEKNIELVDSFLSKSTQEFDTHRIFKVPHTIDCGTGIIVNEKGSRIKLNDKLIEK